jgi:hypothetical protein
VYKKNYQTWIVHFGRNVNDEIAVGVIEFAATAKQNQRVIDIIRIPPGLFSHRTPPQWLMLLVRL